MGLGQTRTSFVELLVINRCPQIQKFCTGLKCTCTVKEGFVGSEMTTGTAAKGVLWLALTALVALSGLCTIFAMAGGDGAC
jgi:hypothetical protein